MIWRLIRYVGSGGRAAPAVPIDRRNAWGHISIFNFHCSTNDTGRVTAQCSLRQCCYCSRPWLPTTSDCPSGIFLHLHYRLLRCTSVPLLLLPSIAADVYNNYYHYTAVLCNPRVRLLVGLWKCERVVQGGKQ